MMAVKGLIATGYFRTGSTFFFSCLRQVTKFRCYYEPYHPELLEFVDSLGDINSGPDREALGHSIGDDYFAEFEGMDRVALENVYGLSRRTTNQPVLLSQSTHQDLYNYIHFLENFAHQQQQISVLQANRLNFSLPWLKQNFPDYLLLLITRNPQEVFASLKSLAFKDGVVIHAEDTKSGYWNVNEAYENVVRRYGFHIKLLPNFGYYQKLYFLLKFSERVMARSADIVLSYESFLTDPKPIFTMIEKATEIDTEPSIDYAKQHANLNKIRIENEYLCELENSVKSFLNDVAKSICG